MKASGRVLLGFACTVVVALVLWPVHFSVLGLDSSCDLPLLNAFDGQTQHTDPSYAPLADCQDRSVLRLFEAVGLLLMVGLSGLVMLIRSRSSVTNGGEHGRAPGEVRPTFDIVN